MSRYRILIFVAATLSATLWAYACGDGTTEPPAPPPDPPRPTAVTVTPATTQLTALGGTVQLTAEVRDQNGQVMAGAGVTWASSNASVATVGGSGLVMAAGNGTATITATAGGVSGSATVTVAQEVSTVTVSPVADTVVGGDTLRLSAEATDENGHAVAGAEFSWESSDAGVATVDASGLVTGVAEGTATITASAGTPSGSAIVTVTPTFTLSGTVSDSRRNGPVLAGAVVRLDNGRQEATGPDGRYRFLNVRGTVTVTVTAAPSYVPEAIEITVDEDRTLDFDLKHTGTPPYGGTVFISPRVIEPSDRTTLGSITYAGRGPRYVYDRRPDMRITIDAYLFDVRYGEHEVEFRVNPEFGSKEAAQAEVQTYAPALGRLPAVLLSAMPNRGMTIHAGHEPWGGGLIHTDRGKDYIRQGLVAEVFVHEGAHVALDSEHRDSSGWRAAQRADGVFISDYARDHPDREDIAESFLTYLAVRYRPERLTDADRAAILRAIPNRLIYFDEQGFDMSPF